MTRSDALLVLLATLLVSACGKHASSAEITDWQKQRHELASRVTLAAAEKCVGPWAKSGTDSAKAANLSVMAGFVKTWNLELKKFEPRSDESFPKEDEYNYKEPDAKCYLAAQDRAQLKACNTQQPYFKRTLSELDALAAKMEKCWPER